MSTKATTFNVGDIVKHKGAFLRSVGWYTDVPKNGKVLGPGPIANTVMVHWCTDEEPTMIHQGNIILVTAWGPN